MKFKRIYLINNLKDLDLFAKDLASVLKDCPKPQMIFLSGDLGSGKTTLTQHVLKHLGINERIKSPTYTLIESYQTENQNIYHMDLYRLQNLNELKDLGIQDLLAQPAIFLVEWPEKLKAWNINPDLTINLSLLNESERNIKLEPNNLFWRELT